jgi:hypothetical protein
MKKELLFVGVPITDNFEKEDVLATFDGKTYSDNGSSYKECRDQLVDDIGKISECDIEEIVIFTPSEMCHEINTGVFNMENYWFGLVYFRY